MSKKKTVAFIFARGGSKGLPGKNIRLLQNKPLIAHSIEFAKSCPQISDIVVSTDSEEIAKVAAEWGATVPFLRPAELATDAAPEMLAWRHAVEYYQNAFGEFDIFLSLPTVSPLRDSNDIVKIIKKLETGRADFVLTGVESDANPYSNLVENREDQGFRLFASEKASRRQDVKSVFRIIPMYYACKPETIFRLDNLFDGFVEMIEIPRHRAVDVDTPEDFAYLEFLSRENFRSHDT